jgi:hypothetical protein
MNNILDIEEKEKKRKELEKTARDILKPSCEEALSEEEYPGMKEDD